MRTPSAAGHTVLGSDPLGPPAAPPPARPRSRRPGRWPAPRPAAAAWPPPGSRSSPAAHITMTRPVRPATRGRLVAGRGIDPPLEHVSVDPDRAGHHAAGQRAARGFGCRSAPLAAAARRSLGRLEPPKQSRAPARAAIDRRELVAASQPRSLLEQLVHPGRSTTAGRAADVDHRRGRSRQRAAVDLERGRRAARPAPRRPAGPAPPRRLALVIASPPTASASAATSGARWARARRSGRAWSRTGGRTGRPGFGTTSVTGPGQQPGRARRALRAARAAALRAGSSTLPSIDRRRLRRRPLLHLVQARARIGRRGRAADPVHGVGRQRRPARRRAAALGVRWVTAIAPTPPARSRQVAVAPRHTVPEPPPARSRSHGAWPAPHSSTSAPPGSRAPSALGHQPRYTSRPSRPATVRRRGSCTATSGSSPVEFAARPRTAGWRRSGRSGGRQRRRADPTRTTPRQARAARAFAARDRQRVLRDVAAARPGAGVLLGASASAIAPDPVPTSRTAGAANSVEQRQAAIDDQLGLGARHEHARVDVDVQPRNPQRPSDVGHRLPLAAAAHELAAGRQLGLGQRPVEVRCRARPAPGRAHGRAAARRRAGRWGCPWRSRCAVERRSTSPSVLTPRGGGRAASAAAPRPRARP